MNAEHTKSLWESFPILYKGRYETLRTSLIPFGFECGDGWYYPIQELSAKLEGINALLRKHKVYIQAVQVKEKYGTLRFYYDVRIDLPWYKNAWNYIASKLTPNPKSKFVIPFMHETDEQIALSRAVNEVAQEMIDGCETECSNHCEVCGTQFGSWNKDEKVETTGWIRIVCKKCAEENNWAYRPYGSADEDECKSVEIPSKKTKAKRTAKRKTAAKK